MTEHLRHEELIDALDGMPSVPVRRHLDGCAACRAELAGLEATLHEAREVEVPAPSPLFWDHFSNRVREATAAESVTPPGAWWRGWWRPGLVAAAAGALVLGIVLKPTPPAAPTPASVVSSVGALPDDGSWGLVMGLASELDATDVREAARPREGTADAMIAELTEAQRAELARLLREDIGEQ
jgi:hypothetical protein